MNLAKVQVYPSQLEIPIHKIPHEARCDPGRVLLEWDNLGKRHPLWIGEGGPFAHRGESQENQADENPCNQQVEFSSAGFTSNSHHGARFPTQTATERRTADSRSRHWGCKGRLPET